MTENALFDRLQSSAEEWRAAGWPCESEPLIGEILRWQFVGGDPEGEVLKFLRWPQFRALEVYWMLRLRFGTPHIMGLYKRLFRDDLSGFNRALGSPFPSGVLDFATFDAIEEKVRTDDEFVRRHGLDALREAAALPYPSYIFALAMGAGKTILIAAIVATEFALALRRPGGGFMQNALVFAPGRTILGSLREISAAPYEDILPPGFHKEFNASARIIYPRDGDPEIQVASRGAFNIIVTNTEKIRLQADARKRGKGFLKLEAEGERGDLVANLRLQKIASLPNLGVFSDEAHHTYGAKIGEKIKRVRETVNYVHEKAAGGIVAVVNTTGTPYHRKGQPLSEVVAWYGLTRGIKDNILKEVEVMNYDLTGEGDKKHLPAIVRDFFQRYGKVALPNGARAKIAFYFRQIPHLRECRAVIANEMAKIGEDPSQILVNTQESGKAEKDEFAALNDPASRKRVVLLVGIGAEGWNCPSLFASAIIKRETSGIFILQASTRCLRQVKGNSVPARIYLDTPNFFKLNSELEKNFGERAHDITMAKVASREIRVKIRKAEELPKLKIVRERRRVVRALPPEKNIRLTRPRPDDVPKLTAAVAVPDFESGIPTLIRTGKTVTFRGRIEAADPLAAAARIAANYHLPALPMLKQIRDQYPEGEVPLGELRHLAGQVERQTARYEETSERVTEVMALIRLFDEANNPLFQGDEKGGYFHTLRLTEQAHEDMLDKGLLAEPAGRRGTPGFRQVADKRDVSFHYAPYNFDSEPERDFFEKILGALNLAPREIQCFLFTGGLANPACTDFYFEYKAADGRFRRYFPDFVVVRKSGEFLVVEVKSESPRPSENVGDKAWAVKRLENLQPGKIRYHIVKSQGSAPLPKDLDRVMEWINEKEPKQKG